MKIAVSTHWNAHRHADGKALVEEILAAGFDRIEAGYNTVSEQLFGIRQMHEQKKITVSSLHNFCPVPAGAPLGHPELYTLADPRHRIRQSAVMHTINTIRNAAELQAGYVVVHAGNTLMRSKTPKLIKLAQAGKQDTALYLRIKNKLLLERAKKAPQQIDLLKKSIEALLPVLQEHKVTLAFENLPSCEALPNAEEMEQLFTAFDSPHIGYWHDTGHARILENLGLASHLEELRRLEPWLKGMHLHDVLPPASDHLPPGTGSIDFKAFSDIMRKGIELVIEPAPGTPVSAIVAARSFLLSCLTNH